ncbi:replication-relaxation family protein [Leekyejoonella antrihumi]|uniref:Replication-relaxation n=1 Tax=Leekyejoonella antrihumi TaxID=1660198 RepID=A0A563DVW0_9MICO|nr:replication-relaxation family protein [Leekyejoonella antrihumi]TWP34410.1 hypothetical protein FGL98_17725 [Leekyejoonella antrihumi]
MTRSDLVGLQDHLTDSDLQLLRDADKYRLLTTSQIQRLYFDHARPTPVAAARACNRTLARLRRLHILKALERRIGGVRAGSAGFVWYVGPAGDRLLRLLEPAAGRGRRNYREPSRYFVDHTLAIAELAVQTIEAARSSDVEIFDLQTEPDSWQQSLSPRGTVQWLKPDLRLVTANGDYEYHWFLEIDLATEHAPVVLRQCLAYQSFRATGRYQATHDTFPVVVWVVPDEHRRQQLRGWIDADGRLDPRLFTVITANDFLDLIRSGGHDTFTNPGGGQKGGTTS